MLDDFFSAVQLCHYSFALIHAKVKRDIQLTNKEILSANVYLIENFFTLFDRKSYG